MTADLRVGEKYRQLHSNAGLSSELFAYGDLFWRVVLNSERAGYIHQGVAFDRQKG